MIDISKEYGFIYVTTNKLNGKKYIGKCIYDRVNNWENYLGSGVYLKRAIKKYGKENFEREIICNAYSEEELNQLEEFYLNYFDVVNSTEYYNIKLTSIGGDIFTFNPNKEAIRKQRTEQMTGKGNHQFGKPKTKKMIESVKKANSKCVIIDSVEYESVTLASHQLGIGISTINYRLNSDNFPSYTRVMPKREVKINGYPCKVGNQVFDSITEAAKFYGISTHAMRYRMNSQNFPDHILLNQK
ncbi:hypothetical protein MHB42_08790 [Lysinibacillus sp. FSL K6-0232]|uniref:hypothetical protein n=1 Tax=unclassified Lysinibacillus TaxID=2636778 RepID=UPI0030F60263